MGRQEKNKEKGKTWEVENSLALSIALCVTGVTDPSPARTRTFHHRAHKQERKQKWKGTRRKGKKIQGVIGLSSEVTKPELSCKNTSMLVKSREAWKT